MQHGYKPCVKAKGVLGFRCFLVLTCANLGALGSGAALAAESETAQAAPTYGDDIIVTAQRRDESLREVPVAISAVSGDALATQGIKDVGDLQKVVPTLTFSTTWAGVNLEIRGIGDDNTVIGSDVGVAANIDGIYLNGNQWATMGLLDLKRVEVLRGPQGTLFGRNATGGAINFVTEDPDPDQWTGYARFTVGNYEARELAGAAGGPVVDGLLGIRFAGSASVRDGFTPNVYRSLDYMGQSRGAYDDADRMAGRIKVVLTPSDTFTAKIAVNFLKDGGRGTTMLYGGLACDECGLLPGFGEVERLEEARGQPRQVNYNEDGYARQKMFGTTANLSWDLGGVRLASNLGYWYRNYDLLWDADLSETDNALYGQYKTQKTYVADLILSSQTEGPFSWLAGVFYMDDKQTSLQNLHYGIPFDPTLRDEDHFYHNAAVKTESWAVFADASYEITCPSSEHLAQIAA